MKRQLFRVTVVVLLLPLPLGDMVVVAKIEKQNL